MHDAEIAAVDHIVTIYIGDIAGRCVVIIIVQKAEIAAVDRPVTIQIAIYERASLRRYGSQVGAASVISDDVHIVIIASSGKLKAHGVKTAGYGSDGVKIDRCHMQPARRIGVYLGSRVCWSIFTGHGQCYTEDPIGGVIGNNLTRLVAKRNVRIIIREKTGVSGFEHRTSQNHIGG
mgnify:CR=1 FL=1